MVGKRPPRRGSPHRGATKAASIKGFVEPARRFELLTCALRVRCSTTELPRLRQTTSEQGLAGRSSRTPLSVKLPRAPRDWDRRTTIVATLGPATGTAESIRRLLAAGGGVVRLHVSRGAA